MATLNSPLPVISKLCAPCLWVLLLAVLFAPAAPAQTVTFGSAQDPLEYTLDPRLRRDGRLAFFGGPSYIGVRWRVGTGFEAEGMTGPFSVALSGRLRAGLDGLYTPDFEEPYDALRAIRYVRHNPTAQRPVYARLGPLDRVTLGQGLLVRDFATTAAWDERTVGLEAAVAFPLIEAAAFVSDVRLNQLVGGRVAVRPFGRPVDPGVSTLELGASAVHDLGLHGPNRTTAVGADAQFDLWGWEDFQLRPFAAYAHFFEHGESFSVGANFGSPDFAGLARLQASAALAFSSERFIPGYFNAFYPVFNPEARIVNSDAYFRDRTTTATAGTALQDAPGGTALLLEMEAALFGTFELAPYVRRDFGGATGAFGVRIGVTPERGQDLRFSFSLHRQGLDGFRDLFSDLVDEAILTFHADYRVSGPVMVFLRSRYGYTRLPDFPDGTARYLVERRFEPMVGISLRP